MYAFQSMLVPAFYNYVCLVLRLKDRTAILYFVVLIDILITEKSNKALYKLREYFTIPFIECSDGSLPGFSPASYSS